MPVDISYVEETVAAFQRAGDVRYLLESLSGYRFESVQITTLTLPTPEQGVAYSTPIAAIGGSESGYAWEVISGALPAGLTLAAAGTLSTTLSGTPSESGIFEFTVRVTDDGGNVDDQVYTFTIAAIPIVPEPPPVSVRFVPAGVGDINGGGELLVTSSTGAFHDLGAQMLTPSTSAPSTWVMDNEWRFMRNRGLMGTVLGDGTTVVTSTEIRTTAGGLVSAGEAQIDIVNWTSTDTDGDFGLEWRTDTSRMRLVLRGTGTSRGVYLEIEVAGTRRVISSCAIPTGYPSARNVIRLRLVYADAGITGSVEFIPLSTPIEATTVVLSARVVCPESTSDSELHLVTTARTNEAVVSGLVTRVETRAALLIDGNLATVTSPATNARALNFIIPRGQSLSRLGRRNATVAGYFGEVTIRNIFTYLPPLRNISTRRGYVRRG